MSKVDKAQTALYLNYLANAIVENLKCQKLQFLDRPLEAGSKSKSVCESACDKVPKLSE